MLLLTACDWFYHAVPYNDKVDRPEMVVTSNLEVGRSPRIYVNESVFFLDPNHNVADTIHEEGIYTYDWINRHLRYNYLTDAEVTMTVNGGTPIRLEGAERLDTLNIEKDFGYEQTRIRSAYSYTTDYRLQPGDRIEITVRHPRYEAPARVVQQMPYTPQFVVENVKLEDASDYYCLATFTLRLLPYQGEETDMLVFSGVSHSHEVQKDAFFHQTRTIQLSRWNIYSQDMSFVGYDKTNNQLSAGYYGANRQGLYRPINRGEEKLTVSVLCYSPGPDCYLDSVRLDVKAVTRDHYLYTSSMIAAGYYSVQAPDVTARQEEENIVEDIQDMFDEMGSMEGIQLYSNVANAIGHVTATSATRPYWYYHKAKKDYENNRTTTN